MKITLPDGKTLEMPKGSTIKEIAEKIGPGLAKAALAGVIDTELKDLTYKVEKDAKIKIITAKDNEGKEILNHSTSHIMAKAVTTLFPETKLTIGPALLEGYYYDFYKKEGFKKEDIEKIEKEMQKIIDANEPFERVTKKREDAIKYYKDNKFKKEIIEKDIPDTEISFYKTGDFMDLCRGPHVPSTGYIKAFKITNQSSSYWRASDKNESLQRVYGIAFSDKKELSQYLTMKEEAEKRDHRKLGKELDLFVFSDLVGPGLPLWTPKGTILRSELDGYVWELRKEKGYMKVTIPHITKRDLYETSGHWAKFADELFKITTREGHEFAMKPMNCPHHTQIYARMPRSYKDMPQRYAETTMVYRDEQSGELSGLSRVRCITQDDAHVFCRHNQVKTEFNHVLDIIKKFYSTFGFKLRLRLSFHDPNNFGKYLGTKEIWKTAENELEEMAKESKIEYFKAPGEAAMYGPKMDFLTKDSLGREWQVATVQLDMNLPERFDLTCINEKGEKERIVMIHAAIMGSIERFSSVMIEHFAGKFPTWISPVQAIILPISDKQKTHALELASELKNKNIRIEVNDANETLDYRIREAQIQKVPYMVVIGDKEIKEDTLNIRNREGKTTSMKRNEFIKYIEEKIKNKSLEL